MVSEVQSERVLSETFFLSLVTSLVLFRTLLNRNLWMNPLSDAMGGDCEWRTEADHRVHRERNHDDAFFSGSDVDIRRKDGERLEEDTVQ